MAHTTSLPPSAIPYPQPSLDSERIGQEFSTCTHMVQTATAMAQSTFEDWREIHPDFLSWETLLGSPVPQHGEAPGQPFEPEAAQLFPSQGCTVGGRLPLVLMFRRTLNYVHRVS